MSKSADLSMALAGYTSLLSPNYLEFFLLLSTIV